jgi:two-component system repressor protein LuxO
MKLAAEKIVLVVEDKLPLAKICEEAFLDKHYIVVTEPNFSQAVTYLDHIKPACIVLGLTAQHAQSMDVLTEARRVNPHLPVIVVTPTSSEPMAAEALKNGAFDCLSTPLSPEKLMNAVRNAIERKTLVEELNAWRQALGQSQFHRFIGPSNAMQTVYRIIDSVAASKVSIYIRGEVGTGKELAAQTIHRASPWRARPVITFDCSTIAPELIEKELFGETPDPLALGAPALQGAIRAAHGGTLFINEICMMPMEAQAKLLRFMQIGEVMPIGGTRHVAADIRIIAASDRDPIEQMQSGKLREDLYYRLHVIELEMPPLRDRDDDVLLLAHHFLAQFSTEESKNFVGFDVEVTSMLRSYDWPGNVRQLENVIRNVVVLHDDVVVTKAMMPMDLKRFLGENFLPAANENALDLTPAREVPPETIKPLWLLEKEAILKTLEFTRQDITAAAALLEVSPSTLYRKLQAWKSAQRVA